MSTNKNAKQINAVERFNVACNVAKSINDKKATEEEFGKLYGLYKQSTIGNCNIKKPSMLDIKGSKKWQYWKNCEGMSKEESMNEYADFVVDLADKYGMKK